MLPDFIEVHRRAGTAFDLFPEGERKSIAAKFTALHNLAPEEWDREGVQRRDRPVHLVPVTAEHLAFFSVLPDGRFLIQDFVSQEFLNRYFPAALETAGRS